MASYKRKSTNCTTDEAFILKALNGKRSLKRYTDSGAYFVQVYNWRDVPPTFRVRASTVNRLEKEGKLKYDESLKAYVLP